MKWKAWNWNSIFDNENQNDKHEMRMVWENGEIEKYAEINFVWKLLDSLDSSTEFFFFLKSFSQLDSMPFWKCILCVGVDACVCSNWMVIFGMEIISTKCKKASFANETETISVVVYLNAKMFWFGNDFFLFFASRWLIAMFHRIKFNDVLVCVRVSF